MRYYCTFWKDSAPAELHVFTLEPKGASQYRASVSMNAFNDREGRRLLKDQRIRFRAHIVNGYDHGLRTQNEKRAVKQYNLTPTHLPTFYHDSIWDVYKAIGYDYKQQRYVRTD